MIRFLIRFRGDAFEQGACRIAFSHFTLRVMQRFMPYSARLPSSLLPTALSRMCEDAEIRFDLTRSNPTTVDLDYPHEGLAAALGEAAGQAYAPTAQGSLVARQALSARIQGSIEPQRIFLTSTTSEAYSLIFKLLCAPGSAVAVPQPSYPLLEHLVRLEGLEAVPYRLGPDPERRWRLDLGALERRLQGSRGRVRVLLAVSPNNPTGIFLRRSEWLDLLRLCCEQEVVLVSDEVFGCFPLGSEKGCSLRQVVSTMQDPPLCFVLDGLSKRAGMPQMKVSWMEVHGSQARILDAHRGLSFMADTYLSVGPAQHALPRLLELGEQVQVQILSRIQANYRALEHWVSEHPALDLQRAEGGWYAVLRVPHLLSEEAWIQRLATEHGVLVHPGFFYDFPSSSGAYWVLSLLLSSFEFAQGLERLSEALEQVLPPRG